MRFLGFLEVIAQVVVCVLISPALLVVCLGLGIQQKRERGAQELLTQCSRGGHTGELLYVWEDTEQPADIDKEKYKYVALKVTES